MFITRAFRVRRLPPSLWLPLPLPPSLRAVDLVSRQVLPSGTAGCLRRYRATGPKYRETQEQQHNGPGDEAQGRDGKEGKGLNREVTIAMSSVCITALFIFGLGQRQGDTLTAPARQNAQNGAAVAAGQGVQASGPEATRGGIPVLDDDDGDHIASAKPNELTKFEFPSDGEAITRVLYREAFAHDVRGTVEGVAAYHGTRVACNSPVEDAFVHGLFPAPFGRPHPSTTATTEKRGDDGDYWMAWGVFDGHAGWQTSDLLTRQLIPFVRRALTTAAAAGGGGITDEEVNGAIKRAFLDLDDALVKSAPQTARDINDSGGFAQRLARLMLASAGSCALLALYDPARRKLRVANLGDSRAVLGEQKLGPGAGGEEGSSSSSAWTARDLSVDQAGTNEAEVARINAEHPGVEGQIVMGGRVLGIMVSRALGDGRWKWDMEFQEELKDGYGIQPLSERYPLHTPPYLSAEPEITTTTITKGGGPKFLILASDGLWDFVSSQRAVQLVGDWMRWREEGNLKSSGRPARLEGTQGERGEKRDFGRFDLGKQTYNEYEGTERDVFCDDNVAVHLVRNALGGAFEEMLAARLLAQAPIARHMRDDVTVQVIFFE